MKKIHVAIIDDGVNEKYSDSLYLNYNIAITDDLQISPMLYNDKWKISHGTICAVIMKKYNKNIIISSIKILNDKMVGDINKLVEAIKWCIDNNIDIINLSLGTVNFKDKRILKGIVNKAYDKGIIIVASKCNDDIITYPACFYNVIGVKCDRNSNLEGDQFLYSFESIDGVDIIACGRQNFINYIGDSEKTENWNSYATPVITAIVANIIEMFPKISLSEIKKQLWRKSINYNSGVKFYEAYSSLEWISNALILGKNLIKYEFEKFIFNTITTIYCDYSKKQLFEIKNLLECSEVLDKIDTVILDLFEVENFDYNCSYLEKILEIIRLYKKDIVIINRVSNRNIYDLLRKYSINVYFNPLEKANIEYKEDCGIPTIAILDYSSNLGYQTPLMLSKKFEFDGYNAITFSSDMRALYYDNYYLPLGNISRSYAKEKYYANIERLVKLLNGDLAIIDISFYYEEYINLLDAYIDLYVVVANKNIDTHLLKFTNKEKLLFMILEDSEVNNGDLYIDNKLESLYKQILLKYKD